MEKIELIEGVYWVGVVIGTADSTDTRPERRNI